MSTVLIIDDDAQMRGALALYVKRLGHAVVEAATLTEGRALQAAEDPDLTIVDCYLPDGTAFDLIESARERAQQKRSSCSPVSAPLILQCEPSRRAPSNS